MTTNSALPETGFSINSVASACNEPVHSKVVTAIDDKTSFLNVNYSLTFWSYQSLFPLALGQYIVHGNAVQVIVSLQGIVWGTTSNMRLTSARCWITLQESILEYHQVP